MPAYGMSQCRLCFAWVMKDKTSKSLHCSSPCHRAMVLWTRPDNKASWHQCLQQACMPGPLVVPSTPASDTKRPETEAQRPKPRSPKLRSPKPRSPKLRSPKQPAAAAPSENQEKKSKKRKKEKRRVGDKKLKTNEGESCLPGVPPCHKVDEPSKLESQGMEKSCRSSASRAFEWLKKQAKT